MGNWLCHSQDIVTTTTSDLINTSNNRRTPSSTSVSGGGGGVSSNSNGGDCNYEATSLNNNDEEILLKVYSFADMRSATRNFRPDCTLGIGGFGTVYKGWVNQTTLSPSRFGTGMMVAVKKLNQRSTQGIREWESEVNILGKLSHPNLVKLLGYCWEDQELLLVYEFVLRGSLENHLFGRRIRGGSSSVEPLSWDIRLNIAIGAARGLRFLHGLAEKIIYRDFKASNILLDSDFNAKISDFGLAKFGPEGEATHVSTRVMGTSGYAAPEYIATGHLYVKSDVYGFGVVLLEILTGLQAIDKRRPNGQQNLVEWLRPSLKSARKLKSVIDPGIQGQIRIGKVSQVAKLILQCLEADPRKRSSMKEVVVALEQIRAV